MTKKRRRKKTNNTFFNFLKSTTGTNFKFPEEAINDATAQNQDDIMTELIKNKLIEINKGIVWEFDDLNNKNTIIQKTFHSVILYFLGIKLKGFFEISLKKTLKRILIKTDDFSTVFSFDWLEYLWRLTSFYHDVMAKFEKDDKKITKKYLSWITCPLLTVENFLNDCKQLNFKGLKYSIYRNELLVDNIIQSTSLKNVDCTYGDTAETIVNSYFRKRVFSRQLDHGIISGYVFYNQLVKNYIEKDYKNSSNKAPDGSFKIGSLNYRPVHLVMFKLIADAIIVHNIWHYNEHNKYDYIPWGLKKLSNINRLSLRKNPLAFMLGLLDTIEPVKYFTNKNEKPTPKEILSAIEIIPDEKEKSLILKLSDKYEDRPEWKQYFNEWYHDKAEGMKDWLEVEVWKGENVINISILE